MKQPMTLRLARALWSAFVSGCGGEHLSPAIQAHVPAWRVPTEPPPRAFAASRRAHAHRRDGARWQGVRP
jgi:hypothetical protein